MFIGKSSFSLAFFQIRTHATRPMQHCTCVRRGQPLEKELRSWVVSDHDQVWIDPKYLLVTIYDELTIQNHRLTILTSVEFLSIRIDIFDVKNILEKYPRHPWRRAQEIFRGLVIPRGRTFFIYIAYKK